MPSDIASLQDPDYSQLITSLKVRFQEEIEKIQDQTNIYQHLRKRALESKLDRLHNIEKALNIDKYSLVFIGTVGVGKTTAICHLYNLISIFNVTDSNTKKTVERLQELLSTGSGRTTICEVIIKPSPTTYIEIDPYPIEKMENLINEFCQGFVNNDESEPKSTSVISIEIDRAIRNVINFKKETHTTRENGKKTSKTIDKAKEALETLGFEEFKQMAFLNADLESRTQNKIYHSDSDGDEKQWIKKTFNLINQAEIKTFSIPKKIYLHISPSLLDHSLMKRVSCIIDTKGIDENPMRPDLNDYIDREDTICIFATSFNDAPEANMRELMRYYLGSKSKNYHHRFVTFVMPKKGEPEQENDGDGTWDTGVEIKKEVIQSVFNSLSLDFFEENIVFFDSLRYYHNGKLLPDFDEADIVNSTHETIDKIDSVIQNRKKILCAEILDLERSLEDIRSGQALSDTELQKIQHAVQELRNHTDLSQRIQSFVYDAFIDHFVDYYRYVYKAWNTKHAIHRRFGTFYERDISLFYDGKIVAEGEDDEKMLKKFTSELRDRLENIIDNLSSAHRDLESLIPELERQLEVYYDEFIQSVGLDIENFLEGQKLAPQDISSDLWKALLDEKGKPRKKGETYTDNVCLILKRHLEEASLDGDNLNRFLQKSAEKNWEIFINKLLRFFGD